MAKKKGQPMGATASSSEAPADPVPEYATPGAADAAAEERARIEEYVYACSPFLVHG